MESGQSPNTPPETAGLVAREHPRPERAPDDAEKARTRDLGPGILQHQKPTNVANQRQPVRTRRFGFLPAPGDESPDDVRRDRLDRYAC
jgi:hypothetical protein